MVDSCILDLILASAFSRLCDNNSYAYTVVFSMHAGLLDFQDWLRLRASWTISSVKQVIRCWGDLPAGEHELGLTAR